MRKILVKDAAQRETEATAYKATPSRVSKLQQNIWQNFSIEEII